MNILIIGLSNVGDAVLMAPVIQRVRVAHPDAFLTVLVGERAKLVFERDARIDRLVSMDEFDGGLGRLRLLPFVWSLKPDAIVDLRQTILPLCWKPWRFWRYAQRPPRTILHMRDRHLWRLAQQLPSAGKAPIEAPWLWLTDDVREAVQRLLARWGIVAHKPLVVISPGARSHTKRWYANRFARVADRLVGELGVEVVFTGEPAESAIIEEILEAMKQHAYSAVSSLTVQQLAALMERAALAITNDSAALHVASAVGAPVLALFGPTSPAKYGPLGARGRVIQRRLFCAPCEQALCRYHHECMRFISEDEVFAAAADILAERVA